MIRMLALDLDDTTLQDDGTLSDITRNALAECIAAGVCVVVASGRSFAALPEEIRKFSGISYAVVSNGAAVCEMPNGKILRSYQLPAKAIHALAELVQNESDILIEVGMRGQMYAPSEYVTYPDAFRQRASVVSYIQRTRKPVSDMTAFLQEHQTKIDCMDLICPNEARRDAISLQVRRTIPDVYVTSSVPQLVEIAHKDAGKANGIRFLAERIGIAPSQIMACGNADNDSDMLAYAGLGVAVANATPNCLKAADVVTESNMANGVAKALYSYLLLQL